MFNKKYIAFIEAENARLRLENRALLNSVLSFAGAAPVEGITTPKELPSVESRGTWRGIGRRMRKNSANVFRVLQIGDSPKEATNGKPSA